MWGCVLWLVEREVRLGGVQLELGLVEPESPWRPTVGVFGELVGRLGEDAQRLAALTQPRERAELRPAQELCAQ